MQTLHYAITIDAPKEKVWWAMLGKGGYPIWASCFSPGRHYEGVWEEGAEIKFLDDQGNGQFSEVVAHKLFEYAAVMHHQPIEKWKKQVADPDACPAFEEFKFVEVHGRTEISVSVDTTDKERDLMDEVYPQALNNLKLICEKEDRFIKNPCQMV